MTLDTGDLQKYIKEMLDTATVLTVNSLHEDNAATMRQLAKRFEEARNLINDKLGGLQGKLNAKAFGRSK
jgi:hypothetical protein